MAYLSVSTWSLHRLLGPLRWTVWDAETGTHQTSIQEQPQRHTLLELPNEAASRGYQALEICHFHFPSTDANYLKQLKQAFADAGISFDTLLLDYGDLTDSDELKRTADMAYIRRWIDIAAQAGAKQIRVIAGEASPSDHAAIRQAATALKELASYASPKGVRVITENFKPLTSTAASSMMLLDEAGPEVGFITDFGNYRGPGKQEEIGSTAGRSVSVHAKPNYDENGYPDADTLLSYLTEVQNTGYNGSYVLIYDGPGDMWEGLERIKTLVIPFITEAS